MNKRDFLTIFVAMWATIATGRWYKNSVDVDKYKEYYLTAKERQLEAMTYYNETMKDLSVCHAEHANTTGLRWKCEETLYDLRKWVQEQYKNKEL